MACTAMSSAREAILAAIQEGRRAAPASAYTPPAWSGDIVQVFAANARATASDVHTLASISEVPEAVWALLRATNAIQRLHIAPTSPFAELAWQRAPGLTISRDPPSGNDTALSRADYAVAETGTLVFLSGPEAPSSWHFRPGREIALVERAHILPRLEDVFTEVLRKGMPATINLVTGPSRTADIEQTIERGAHGPRSLDIVVMG
jgi:L-lactate dehydrogenase complex protein LldG